jgi:hypothetical protein
VVPIKYLSVFWCLLLVFAASSSPLSAQSFEGLRLSAADWNLGTIPVNRKPTMRLRIANESGSKRQVTILPTCPCLTVQRTVELLPGQSKDVTIAFDPEDSAGPVNLLLIFLTDDPESKGCFFRVYGSVVTTSERKR